jgi:hypothetical protein
MTRQADSPFVDGDGSPVPGTVFPMEVDCNAFRVTSKAFLGHEQSHTKIEGYGLL